jgi:hypothetical protein
MDAEKFSEYFDGAPVFYGKPSNVLHYSLLIDCPL